MGGYGYEGRPEYHTYYPDGEMDKKVFSVVEHFPRDYSKTFGKTAVREDAECDYCGALIGTGKDRCDSCGAPRKVRHGT